jgi:hypothetical protein
MHGSYDYLPAWLKPFVPITTSLAGTWMKIHHNTFSDFHSDGSAHTSVINGVNIMPRGKPRSFCDVYENWFFDDNISHAVREKRATGNMTVWNNYVSMDQNPQDTWDPLWWSVNHY